MWHQTFGHLTQDILVALFALYLVPLFHFTRSSKADRAIGELSYAVYVVHLPIIGLLMAGHNGSALWTALLMLVSVAAAIFLNVFIERKVDRWRTRDATIPGAQVALVSN